MKKELLEKYAKVAIQIGVNLQKNQDLIINCNVNPECVTMARLCTREAYEQGARKVIVNFSDEQITRSHYEYQSVETLCDIKDYEVEARTEPLRNGCALLRLDSEVPGILKGIDTNKISESAKARQSKMKEASEITMASKVQWCIIGVPNVEWAKKVFPELKDEDALESLWNAILKTAYVDEDSDAVENWQKHNNDLMEHREKLNEYNFKSLHFTNKEGTDLIVELINDHVWGAGDEECSTNGAIFTPNMPTEEVFCMPYKFGVNGTVVSTKPLDYNGVVIPKFKLTFKAGKVVEYEAESEYETLKSLIEFDEGSCYLGEVALVPYHSPISLSNLLYFNTLYDENASCHLALGRAYPMNVKGGVDMSQEELNKIGSNDSMTHVDFMFGSEDMHVVGLTQDNQEIDVFINGDFVL